MSLKLKLYIIGAVLGITLIVGVLHHYYALGTASALRKQAVAVEKLHIKNRKSDAKIDRKTPASDKRATIEWLSKYTR